MEKHRRASLEEWLTREIDADLEELVNPTGYVDGVTELVGGVDFRYNADGEYEFLGLWAGDREAWDTDMYHSHGYDNFFARENYRQYLSESRDRVARKAAWKEKRAAEAAEAERKQRASTVGLKTLNEILKRPATAFERSFFTPAVKDGVPCVRFSLVTRERMVDRHACIPASKSRVFNSEFDFVAYMLANIQCDLAFAQQIPGGESGHLLFSFTTPEAVRALIGQAGPECYLANMTISNAVLNELAVIPMGGGAVRNFSFVRDNIPWKATAAFTRKEYTITRHQEFSLGALNEYLAPH